MGGQGRDMEELQTDPQADLGTAQPLSQAALEAPTESHTVLFSNPQSSAQAGCAPPPTNPVHLTLASHCFWRISR